MNRKNKLRNNSTPALMVRNPLHNHPLLQKGGMHKKTNKALRRKNKVNMNKEWLTQNIVRILSKPFLMFSTHQIKSINIANK